MIYSGRIPYGINQVESSSLAITVENTDIAVFTTGSLLVSGSVTSLGGFTGSFSGSFIGSANLFSLTSSNALVTGNVIVLGTASINTLVVNQTQLSTGSNQLGDAANDTQTLYGSVIIPTGSLTVTGSSFMTGSLTVTGGITGSLFGTASYTPTLAQVTTAGNTTTNNISVGSTFVVGDWTSRPTNVYVRAATGGAEDRGYYIGVGSGNDGNGGSLTYNATTNLLSLKSPYNSGTIALSLEGNTNSVQFHNTSGTAVSKFVSSTGNLLIGTTTDAGFKLDVSGSGRFSGNLTVSGSASNSLLVKGSGATSSTNGLLIQNSAGTAAVTVKDDLTSLFGGSVQIYNTGGGYLDVRATSTSGRAIFNMSDSGQSNFMILNYWGSASGQGAFNNSFITSLNGANYYFQTAVGTPNASSTAYTIFYASRAVSFNSVTEYPSAQVSIDSTTKGFLPPRTNLTSNISTPAQGLQTYITSSATEGLYYYSSGSIKSWTKVLNDTGSQNIAGTLAITGSAGTGSALTVYKSGSTVMSIQGSQGELFSITDSLSGSLFSVSNISGLPILEVFSDNTTLIGNYLDPMLVTTQLVTANSGSTTVYSLPTASYDGAFYDYVVRSGSNSRAGQIMAIWSGSSVNYTDNSTTDFGSTANLSFNVIVSGSNMVLRSTVTTGSWTVKTIIRSI